MDPVSGIRDGKKSDPGSGINIPDPQHWKKPIISVSMDINEQGGQREGTVEGQQYTRIVPASMGATVHKLGRKYKL